MVVFRLAILLLLLAAIVCLGLYLLRNDRRWLHLGVAIIKWTLVAALGFFAVLIVERIFWPAQ
ncbi:MULTISPECIES: hypothetical protein [Caldimonas]|uniref:hypothetical protein n=1 Tax=Caldimonas TaxID=196013 RepID=UPI000364D6C6|nr:MULTISPECIES: hypothetical protein [Caldimonas]MCX7659178.1 hypothetical protein [Caldimonas manganoxidans]GIX23345.1 MAG: hypothetical protein KatS3mg122_0576 [Caldimonas sp.]